MVAMMDEPVVASLAAWRVEKKEAEKVWKLAYL
jgi:hypothetical protein